MTARRTTTRSGNGAGASKGAPKGASTSAKHRVQVRMYRQGLGDCFLLSFPKPEGGDFHMLIDCGVVLGTVDPRTVMRMVAEDIKETTRGNIDVLAITHEHWDHLSGFDPNQAGDIFSNMTIGALWLPWTEDQNDPLARSLREERQQKKKAAARTMQALRDANHPDRSERISKLLQFFGEDELSAKATGGNTEAALKYLKRECAPTPTILETGSSFLLPGFQNVRIYVMGPPKDRDALRRTNPSQGEGYGLVEPPISLADAFLAAFDPEDERAQPFDRALRCPLKDLQSGTEKPASHPRPGVYGYYHEASKWRNIDDAWLATGERLALQLDNATNNTSLVLAIELDGKDVLLFVGDAQAGNWRSWEERQWKVKDQEGEMRTVSAADLLHRTIFYKVGHHGSHNATLKAKGLELMTSDRLTAVIPVDTKVAHDVKGWEHMPLPAIQARLRKQCALFFQADQPAQEMRQVPGIRWVDSTKQFDVRMKDRATDKTVTVRTEHLYTDYFA